MAIDPVALAASTGMLGVTSPVTTSSTGGVTSVHKGGDVSDAFGLSRDDFFKLFLAQLQHQDPTKPMDDQQMIAELAQFSLIDTMKSVEKSLAGQQLSQASSLIGRQVQGLGVDGQPLTGVVDRLYQDPDGIVLIVNGRGIKPDNVTLVSADTTTPPVTPAP